MYDQRKELVEEMKEMIEAFLKEDALFDLCAKMMMKSYDALIRTGFTKEQAIQIVAAQGSFVKGGK